ncbi:MAG: DUF3828 domain-containing protein [Anaerolineales bacterium]
MNAKRFLWMLVVMTACVALSGCASLVADGAEPAPTPTETPEPAQPVAEAPEAVVEAFYSWYLDYSSETGNPMVDEAYKSSEYLTDAFVQEVDELLASFEGGGYDPFLCAQDVPQEISVVEMNFSGDHEAQVGVQTSFEGHSFDVLLQREGDQWKIADVICPSPGNEGTSQASPFARSEIAIGQFILGFSMPSDWTQQGSEWVWRPVRGGEGRFGVNVAALEPPMEAEAVLLPEPAQALASEPMELDWAQGARSFTIEVYGPAPQGSDEKAPVEAVQKHVLATVHEDGQRTGIDLYVSAPSMRDLSALEPLLETVLRSAQLD